MIIYAAYRRWALDCLPDIKNCGRHHTAEDIVVVRSPDELNEFLNEGYNKRKVSYILFIGWSWIVDPRIVEKIPCYAFHPSKLPEFRGGSPIQNQIMAGVTETYGTLFRMTDRIDAGGILYREKLSLKGDMDDIFLSLQYCVLNLITWFNNWGGQQFDLYKKWPEGEDQNEDDATWFPRRQPEDSEILMQEMSNESDEYLYNKIRMLGSPYPNAYITCKNGKKLYLTASRREE
jgi:methionyl-tRNA formyltransferase